MLTSRLTRTGLLLIALLAPALSAQPAVSSGAFEETHRFAAAEAFQGIAVDDRFVYAVDSRAIGKYDKATGERVAVWQTTPDLPIRHLDSGVVVGDRLYAAHSNYPAIPMTSSIEVWDAETLDHVASHSFGIYRGSATWADVHDGSWWVAFAHYDGDGGEPGKGPSWTSLVRFDEAWREQEAWVFPPEVVARMAPHSNSGGSWGPDGRLYVTGHDRPEVYVLRLPAAGSELVLEETLALSGQGQGIAWDRSAATPTLYGIHRDRREVIASVLTP